MVRKGQRIRVLVVEDESAHVALVRRSFETRGSDFELLQTDSIESALRRLEEQPVDVVLCDFRLPDGQGTDLLSRSQRPVALVVMTSQGDEGVAVEVMKAGALDYVVKSESLFKDLPHVVERARRQSYLLEERARSHERFRAQYDCILTLSKAQDLKQAAPVLLARAGKQLKAQRAELWLRGAEEPLERWPSCGKLEEANCTAAASAWAKTHVNSATEGGYDVLRPQGDAAAAPSTWVLWEPISQRGQPHSLLLLAGVEDPLVDEQMEARELLQSLAVQIGGFLDRCKLQEELVERERLAALGTATALFAHEVGNPLNNLSLQTQLLARRVQREKCHPSIRSSVDILGSEIARLEALLREFRALSRRQVVSLTRVNLGQLLYDVVQPQVTKETPHLNVSIRAEEPLLVLADGDKLVQIFLNLIKNAREAMHDEGKLEVVAERREECVVIEFFDTGPGLPEELDVFALFETTKAQGTGLGLPVVRSLVKAHGGTVSGRNRAAPEKGAVFSVVLPGALET